MSSEDAKNLQNMSSGESSAFRKLLIGYLGSNTTAEDLKDLFGLNCEEKVKQLITIELSSGPEGRNMALVHLPEDLLKEGLSKHGTELHGRSITVKDPADSSVLTDPSAANNSAGGYQQVAHHTNM